MKYPYTPIVITEHNNRAFDSRVIRSGDANECWGWAGSTEKYNRAVFYQANVGNIGRGKNVKAYRYSYERFVGKIPEGWTIDHLCDNPSCTNPEHLEACTWEENERRKWERKTHCKYGHDYKPENRIYNTATKTSVCRPCARAHSHKVRVGVTLEEALEWVEANPLGYKVNWKNDPRCRRCGYKLIKTGKRKGGERRHKRQGYCDICAAKSERASRPPKPAHCAFNSCELRVMAKGLCNTHYNQQLRGEELRDFTPRRKSVDT